VPQDPVALAFLLSTTVYPDGRHQVRVQPHLMRTPVVAAASLRPFRWNQARRNCAT
jgi:hypothetical protein